MSIIEILGITKAPWKWVIGFDYDFMTTNGIDDLCESILDDGSAHGEYSQTIKGDSANAQLIAAAPEMLEALIDLMTCDALKGHRIIIDNSRYSRLIEKATGNKFTWEQIKEMYLNDNN